MFFFRKNNKKQWKQEMINQSSYTFHWFDSAGFWLTETKLSNNVKWRTKYINTIIVGLFAVLKAQGEGGVASL